MNEQITYATQKIDLPSIINARELGGIELPDGRRIKRGKLLRGGALAAASDEDLRRLHEQYHLVHNFDFRTYVEVTAKPDREVEGADRVWLPAIDENTEKVGLNSLPPEAYVKLESFIIGYADNPMVQSVAARMYPDMVLNEYTQLQYASFLQLASNVKDGAVFWHCSQGKDRTGLGAAFMLCALGADRDTIIREFDISNEFYKEDVARLCAVLEGKGWDDSAKDVVRTFIGVNTARFIDTLNLVDMKWGSLESYVKDALLFSDEDAQRLRDNFLE